MPFGFAAACQGSYNNNLKPKPSTKSLGEETMKSTLAAVAASLAFTAFSAPANAQISDDVVKIGVLTDMSSLYADATGKGSLAAVEMAVADYGGKVKGKPVEVISADHQNKPDVGVNIARNWYDNEELDAANVVNASGGKVLGDVRHPLNTSDFSSFLLQAQASKAKVIGLANAGGDTTNALKQAAEFGIIQGGQKMIALLLEITDTHALGAKATQGLIVTDAFYWDMNDETRAFSKRFNDKVGH